MKGSILFKEHLYRSEDEYLLFGLLIPEEFWNSDNITKNYKSLFESKLLRAAENTFVDIINKNYDSNEIYRIFARDLGKNKWKSTHSLLNNLENKYRNDIKIILEDIFEISFITACEVSSLPLEQIVRYLLIPFERMVEDFCNRLKICQKEKSLIDYYVSNPYFDTIDSNNFPTFNLLSKENTEFNNLYELAYFLH